MFHHMCQLRQTGVLTNQRPGPKTAIPPALEADIVEWVAAMQRAGVPVGPAQILMKGNEVLRAMTPRITRSISATPLTRGWYTRFMKCHHVLTDRLARSIAGVRNEVDEDAVSRLFYTLAKLVVEEKFGATRVFNMDETSFMPKTVSRKIIAVKGSVNVRKQQDKLNSHMTLVAAVSAGGGYIPPLLIVPGSRILIKDLHAISVDNTCLPGAPKGFSNTELFKKWRNIAAVEELT
ncbi:hypothetical protein BBJ28_00020975 [Nothophytophthora sp. Chile5]|nr:hypothetical protein BBJ28_00020975 [Nothophytophthora sp. Chile5]